MEEKEYVYTASFKARDISEDKAVIEGIAFPIGVPNKNGWRIPNVEEAKKIAEQMKKGFLRIDHSDSVKAIIGKITDTKVSEDKVEYIAEVYDKDIIWRINKGLIESGSIQLKPGRVASVKLEDGRVIDDLYDSKFVEYSIVLNPAFEDAKFKRIAKKVVDAVKAVFTSHSPNKGEPQPTKNMPEKAVGEEQVAARGDNQMDEEIKKELEELKKAIAQLTEEINQLKAKAENTEAEAEAGETTEEVREEPAREESREAEDRDAGVATITDDDSSLYPDWYREIYESYKAALEQKGGRV